MGVDRRAAEQMLLELEVADRGQDPLGRGHDLRSDPVPGKGDDALRHGGTVSGPAVPGVQRAPWIAPRRFPLNGSVPATSCTPVNELWALA